MPDAHLAEHVVGVGVEVLVDGHRLVRQCPGLLPRVADRVGAGFTAAQDQQIGDHGRAGGPLVCAAGKTDSSHEVGETGDFSAGGGIVGVHCGL